MANYDFKGFSNLGPQADLYTRPNTRVEYQLFSNDYFTGSDVSLYLGDIWIDDIVDFEFSMTEQIMPVFGYASYTADAFVRGNRIIQGSFTINFKSVGYINEVLKHKDPIKRLYSQGKSLPSIERTSHYTLEETLKMYGIKSFDEIAQQYEDKLWKYSDGEESSVNASRGFFGHYDDEDMLDDGLEIKIAYGSREATYHLASNYKKSGLSKPNETIETLVGVHITGVQKGIYSSSGGAPILERYTFVARDLNGNVSLD